ncbi:MAG: hypothetical protein A2Y76_05565 [Planctomycetes bacterium RBG_13_60_9]|nr:MAG: hypothetical protein A2Y76_05565 [Planctomycetes bacterium RBG_13_60_9]
MCSIATGFFIATACGGAKPWTQIELVGRYTLLGDVAEGKDLSGIACISDRFGLLGADEARQVQVIEISRQAKTLRVVETITLARSGPEIDIEAIAAEGDCYYIIGSHGVAKVTGKHQENRYSIFRLRVDPGTGVPRDLSTGGSRVPASLDAASLAGAIRMDPVLREYFGKPLQRKGVNIEGLAARAGRLYVGFRSPNLDGEAFVMEVRADSIFQGGSRLDYTLHRLKLGKGLGIREMVAAKSGFLIMAGNAGSEPSEEYAVSEDYQEGRAFSLFRWDGKGSAVHSIGILPKTAGQAEAMMILEEKTDEMTVLVLFDGPNGGRPSVYRIQ